MSMPFRFVVVELFEIGCQCVIQAGLELVILCFSGARAQVYDAILTRKHL